MKPILLFCSLLVSHFALAQASTQSMVISQSVLPNSRSTQQTAHALLAYNQIQPLASAAYTAGQSITLQPGFEAQAGSAFLATIGQVSLVIHEPISGLRARLLDNPVMGSQAQVAISGVAGQAVNLQLIDLQGRPIHEQRIEQAGEVESVSVPLGSSRGTLLLKVSTAQQQQSLKLVRP